jgi:hypothetical protein
MGGQLANFGAGLFGQQTQFDNLSRLVNQNGAGLNLFQQPDWFNAMQGAGTQAPLLTRT